MVRLIDRQASLDDVKIILDDKNQDAFSSVRKNFTEYLDAVDASLYKKILRKLFADEKFVLNLHRF